VSKSNSYEETMAEKKSAGAARTVLVVDDEAAIRMLARRVLEDAGYQVTEAAGGLDAIELLSKGTTLDLLIADLDMPTLGGDEMVRRIRSTRPDLKVLYVTGHIDRLMDARQLWEGEAFLEKPFTAAGLREAVSLLIYGVLKKSE
jgi:two-component system, cell cycle sensor histidine kinase and response regulator CckA